MTARTAHSAVVVGREPRVLFYSDDRYGLGHVRPMMATAAALARRLPAASLLGITGSPHASAFSMPANFDYVKIPTAWKADLFTALPLYPDQRGQWDGIWSLRAPLIRRIVTEYRPDVIVVESSATGARGELLPALRALRQQHPMAKLVLLLLDIVDDPAEVRRLWRQYRIYDLFVELYDGIVVRGCRDIFDAVAEYDVPASIAAKFLHCGYLLPDEVVQPATRVRAELGAGTAPLIVVSGGGGADAASLIEAYLDAPLEMGGELPHSFITTGPYMPSAQQAAIKRRAAAIPKTTVVTFVTSYLSYLNAADLIVTQAGYSTIAAVLGLGKRAIVVPRDRPWREQLVRAEWLAERGLVHLLRPAELTPARLETAIREALAAPAPAITVPSDGLRCVTDILADRLTG